VQHKGFSAAGREFGEDFFQLLQALQAQGGSHGVVVLVSDRLGSHFGMIRVDGLPYFLFAPMIAQQIARHLEQKRPWLLDLGTVAVAQPLRKHILGHIRRVAGVVRAFTQEIQNVCIKPATGIGRWRVGLGTRHGYPS